jgi:hypothetical protein
LRFVDNHHHAPTGSPLFEKKAIQLVDQLFFCSSRSLATPDRR